MFEADAPVLGDGQPIACAQGHRVTAAKMESLSRTHERGRLPRRAGPSQGDWPRAWRKRWRRGDCAEE
eukprot:7000217-Pyramimonas_sp.AAC.1